MNPSFAVCLSVALATPLRAAPVFQAEAGASAFFMRQHGPLEPGRAPLSIDNPNEVAPFVAGTFALSDRLGLRVSYHSLNDVETTAMFGSPPGLPPSPLPVVVWAHYRDDVHLVSVMPEFKWPLSRTLAVGLAPQLNWVKSEGVISYSTDSALILLQAPRERDDSGFTLGGAARLHWSVGTRASLSLSYQYSDLRPSFNRRANVLSAGLEWRF